MGRVKYNLCTVEEYLAKHESKKFDAVVASEVIEQMIYKSEL